MLIFVLLSLSACDTPMSLHPLDPDAVVLAFGNSLTHGTGAAQGQSYPAILQKTIGRTVINAGVPGELSAQGLTRLPRLLDEHRPQLLLLCHGGNDLLRGRPPKRLERNLRGMITAARQRGIQVVLIGVPARGLFIDTAPVYARVADDMEVPLEDEVIAEVLSDRSLKSDSVHPNGEGYRRIARAVERLLEARGALPRG